MLSQVVVIDRGEALDPLTVGNNAVDHVEHDEEHEQASGPAGCGAGLLGELRNEQSHRSENGADQYKIQTVVEATATSKVSAELRAPRRRQQPHQPPQHST